MKKNNLNEIEIKFYLNEKKKYKIKTSKIQKKNSFLKIIYCSKKL